jgi:hypothetical protein
MDFSIQSEVVLLKSLVIVYVGGDGWVTALRYPNIGDFSPLKAAPAS